MGKISSFDFEPGKIIARKYMITKKLGGGWEGEVYLTSEIATGIERTAKLFFPHRNIGNKTAKKYATKLHDLRSCQSVVQYHSHETMSFESQPITCLISEYVDGILLCDYIDKQKGGKLNHYQALEIIYEVAKAMEKVHASGHYHGDLHSANIIIKHVGLTYHIRLIDCIDWGDSKRENMKKDVYDMLYLYYEMVGGSKTYKNLPQPIRTMLAGMRRAKIFDNFKNAGQLCRHIENITWEA